MSLIALIMVEMAGASLCPVRNRGPAGFSETGAVNNAD
jgi:hypothetical protein